MLSANPALGFIHYLLVGRVDEFVHPHSAQVILIILYLYMKEMRYIRASRTIFVGVSVARMTCENPPWFNTPVNLC